MHAALGNDLAVEVGEFLDQPYVLHQDRAARAGGHAVLVVDNRCAKGGGQRGLLGLVGGIAHGAFLRGCVATR
ncbi:hypothetical protein D3C80_2115450 [compost metagenome]